MEEADGNGAKLLSRPARLRSAVLRVAEDRAAEPCAVHAQLVRPAGERLQLEQGDAVLRPQGPVGRAGRLTVCAHAAQQALRRQARDGHVDHALRRLRHTAHGGMIGLVLLRCNEQSVGVGVFLVIAMLRILFRIPLNRMLIVFYILVFALALFVPEDFLAIAFDSGGVTTGPMTVPFIMALGVGVASIRSDENAAQDSFGLVALCSVGPILAVMVLALIYPGAGVYTPVEIPSVTDSRALWHLFQVELPAYLSEVAVCLAPIALFFAVFQAVSLKLKKKKVLKIVIGILYTYVGLVLFLTGANVGFMPAASYLSRQIAGLSFNWILIPIGMLMGWFIVQAEPAVHVLNKQVEEITSGAIPGKAMSTSLSIGVAVSIGLAMMRVMTGISIFWLVVPGYLAAIVMSFFVPKIFTAIAFDSGGVASGPMTATFLLPFAQGACEALGGNVVTDAFGVVAMVAMTPLLTIQMLGLLYQLKMKKAAQETPPAPVDEEIIEL